MVITKTTITAECLPDKNAVAKIAKTVNFIVPRVSKLFVLFTSLL